MKEFLRSVVKHYFNPLPLRSDGTPDYVQMTDWLFVFPNRRAGLFFGKYLCEENGGNPVLSPRFLTIGDLFGLFSEYRVADRTELLFLLYKVYCNVRAKHGMSVERDRFEQFIFWGEMMLRDFEEVDKYLVDAKSLFCNIKDLNEIESRFGDLDSEVIDILRTFWINVSPEMVKPGSAKESFTQTWGILYEIYEDFRAALTQEGFYYEGLRQRMVVSLLDTPEMEAKLRCLPSHIVLAGITAINEAERALLLWLKKKGGLECCWDYADEHVQDLPFIKKNLEDFGNALTEEEQRSGIVSDAEKTYSRMAVSTGVGQAAEASRILYGWRELEPINTAVVLSDEKMLNSTLYALPKEYDAFNVTMGYALKQTPVATLVESLIFLQNNVRFDSIGVSYYYKAVLPILSHSFILELEKDHASNLKKTIFRGSKYLIYPSDLHGKSELFQLIFPSVRDKSFSPIQYLHNILIFFLNAFNAESKKQTGDASKDDTPDRYILIREGIIVYLKILDQLEQELQSANMTGIDVQSKFHLIQKLAMGQSVSFSGEPMQGLQIMGVLETRALDFERIVMLSTNEGVVPSKPSQNTFIPFSLRQAFGLPIQIYKDQVFAYHFYRLLSRAKEVVFLYDSRTNGMQTGEQSRYLLQLEYLYGVKFKDLTSSRRIVGSREEPIVVKKTAEVMAQMSKFQPGGDGALSASSLKTFLQCPLQFYFVKVRGLSSEDEMEEEMDDSKFGTILHNSLKQFYSDYEGQWIDSGTILRTLNDERKIRHIVSSQYKKSFGCDPVSGYQQLVCSLISRHFTGVLNHDCSIAPFYYVSGEKKCSFSYQVKGTDLRVNLKAYLDRLDMRKDETSGEYTLRVVDYKTGKAQNFSKLNVSKLFDGGTACSPEAMQVLLYCLMVENLDTEHKEPLLITSATPDYQHVQPNLYFTRAFLSEDSEVQTEVISDYRKNGGKISDTVTEQFDQLLKDLFDPSIPFTQTSKENNCKFCKFIEICNKVKKND